MKFLIAVCVIAMAQGAFAQKLFPGQCQPLNNEFASKFDIFKFLGRWIGVESIPFMSGSKCTTGNYAMNSDGTLDFTATGILPSGQAFTYSYPAHVVAPAQIFIQYDKKQTWGKPNYHIVGTNYKTYAAVMNCKNVDSEQYELTGFVLGREKKLSDADLAAAHADLKRNNLDVAQLVPTDQTNC